MREGIFFFSEYRCRLRIYAMVAAYPISQLLYSEEPLTQRPAASEERSNSNKNKHTCLPLLHKGRQGRMLPCHVTRKDSSLSRNSLMTSRTNYMRPSSNFLVLVSFSDMLAEYYKVFQ